MAKSRPAVQVGHHRPTRRREHRQFVERKACNVGCVHGRFDLTVTISNGTTGCKRSSPASASNGDPTADYIPHHAFFQYHASTANPTHVRPKSETAPRDDLDGYRCLMARNCRQLVSETVLCFPEIHSGLHIHPQKGAVPTKLTES
jgi:hypothetical protein